MARKPPRNAKLDREIAKREAELADRLDKYSGILDKRAEQYAHEVAPTWKKVDKDLTAAIRELYEKYADEDGKLDKTRLREVEKLKFLREHTAKMSRTVSGQEEKLTNHLAYTYTDAYYFNAFAMQDVIPEFNILAPALTHGNIIGVIANPWLTDGMTYSDRLRANTVYLGGKMREAVETAVARGQDIQKTARNIQNIAGEGYYNSVRLARTEMNRAAGQASSHVFMQNADILSGKRWNATLDSRTAPKDADNDRKIYDLEYDTPDMPGRPGERIPNHPNCRCKWSPVLAALGVREGERIARGEGDSLDNFGERIYTNAKDYKAYAKERGINLEERLRNDDPSRYLRRDERGEKPAPVITAVTTAVSKAAAVAAVAPWVTQAKDIVAAGVDSEVKAREVGGILRQEIEKGVAEAAPVLQANIDKLAAEADTLYNDLKNEGAELRRRVNSGESGKGISDEVKAYNANLTQRNDAIASKRRELAAAKQSLSAIRADVAVKKLAEIRPMGSSREHSWVPGSQTKAKEALAAAQKYYPTAWLEKSQAFNPLEAKVIKRGYYQGYSSYSKFRISGVTPEDLHRVAVHELGHRMEHINPTIRKLEKEFYDRRTAGDPLKWLGKGYDKSEKARFDNNILPNMGKDYGNKEDSYYEIFTMGAEGIFAGSYQLDTDPDYYNFILGVMASQ